MASPLSPLAFCTLQCCFLLSESLKISSQIVKECSIFGFLLSYPWLFLFSQVWWCFFSVKGRLRGAWKKKKGSACVFSVDRLRGELVWRAPHFLELSLSSQISLSFLGFGVSFLRLERRFLRLEDEEKSVWNVGTWMTRKERILRKACYVFLSSHSLAMSGDCSL